MTAISGGSMISPRRMVFFLMVYVTAASPRSLGPLPLVALVPGLL
jgi:hypothetical protein